MTVNAVDGTDRMHPRRQHPASSATDRSSVPWTRLVAAAVASTGTLLAAGLPGLGGTGTTAAPAAPALPHGLAGAVEIPDPWRWWRLSGLALLVLVVCATGLWLWWRRGGAGQAGATALPPGDVARRRLQQALELLGQPPSFVAEVSAAVREYLEGRFGWRAPERTTEEFIGELQARGGLPDADRQALADFLGACDMVKFAGVRPDRLTLEEMHASALRLVNELAPAAEGPSSPSAGSGRSA